MNFPRQFIRATQAHATLENPVPAPYFRKTFSMEKTPDSAEILITALGFYELTVNGHPVTQSVLAPFITAPNDIVTYERHNVTHLIKAGTNVIVARLGNGFQNTEIDIWAFDKATWVGPPCFAMSLEMDGTQLESDTTFACAPSPIVYDGLRYGEIYDANREKDFVGIHNPDYDDTHWPKAQAAPTPAGEATLNEALPILPQGRIKPVSVTPHQDGYLYDFGINLSGVFELCITGQAGQAVELFMGEWLKNGQFTQENIHFARAKHGPTQYVKYICAETQTPAVYTPTFTYFGYQYILVKGLTEAQATPDLLTAIILHTDLKETGQFTSSCETLNQLQLMTRRSTLFNFHHFPTDCPHREKNGWTGDAALSCEHTLLNLNPEKNYAEWLKSIRKAQNDAGALPGIVPTGGWGFTWGNGPAWDCVLTYLPYFTYKYRGDKKILSDNATAIFRYVHYLSVNINPRGLIDLGLGDWCPAGESGANNHKTPAEFTDTVICMDICEKAAFIFDVLGWGLQRDFAQALYEKLRKNARERLIDWGTYTAFGACQTAQAMAIFYHVFEPGEKPAAFARLLQIIQQNGNKLDFGILGGRVLFHVLADFNRADLAYEMITTPDFPSYGYWVAQGLTTLPENFARKEAPQWSLNHHFFGDITNFFITKLGGIRVNPTGRDANEVAVAPHFIDALTSVDTYTHIPPGKVSVSYTKKDGGINLNITLPPQGRGCVTLPPGYAFEGGKAFAYVQEGTHHFQIRQIP